MLTNETTFIKSNPHAGKIIASCRGYAGKMFGIGSDRQVNGIFVLTEQSLHFFKNGLVGKVHEEWSLDKLFDISFTKRTISTKVILSGFYIFPDINLASSWRKCEAFVQELWRRILASQSRPAREGVEEGPVKATSSTDTTTQENAASDRVKQLLRIHTDIPLNELEIITQDKAWGLLRDHSPNWYQKDEIVYLYGFDREDKAYMKERLTELGIKTATKLSRSVSIFVTSDMSEDYTEMTPKKAEVFDDLMDQVSDFGTPLVYEFELDEVIRKLRRRRLLSDHFSELVTG